MHFGVKKFHAYLFGHPFELVTDHKPLLTLLNAHKATSPQASNRIRRWSLILAAYEYTIVFKKTEEHGNADAFSRLPLQVVPAKVDTHPEIVLRHSRPHPFIDEKIPLTVCSLQQGWPAKSDPKLAPYFSPKTELSAGWLYSV